MKITNKLLKTMIGEQLWTIPVGNSVQRGRIPLEEQIKSHMITKVGTKTVTVNEYTTFRIDGTLDRNNYGYLPFLTKEDALEYLELEQFKIDLRYNMNLNKLSTKDLKAIILKY